MPPVSTMTRRRQPTPPAAALSRGKLWAFRLTAAGLLPLLFVGILELVLRLSGFGYATGFLLESEVAGVPVWIQNDAFSRRFFGRNMAREPQPFAIPRTKPANTIRVFVFGESAAYGDPQPAFGLPRMLQTLLNQRFPATHFEVVNAAMTGINSYAVRDIARDCARADGDFWVIYMGNNEVVGPFGAGTVFSRQTPSLGFIRASLALRATRTGQMFDALGEWLHPPPENKSEWGGMTMFLDQAVAATDPRMERVYSHFQHNLRAIIASGRNAGARVIVSTVGVNLKDCAPFASALPALSPAQQQQWRELYQRGVAAQNAGNLHSALAAFDAAARRDASPAELQFRRAQCLLALGQTNAAWDSFSQARDRDTLRFRCDRRLNTVICETAVQEKIPLADAERALVAGSADGIPGAESFYEHVHLTWPGNWRLARALAQQIAGQLPAEITRNPAAQPDWPSPETCAAQLAWTDTARREALTTVRARIEDPPFTHQLDHAAQLARLATQLDQLAATRQPAGRTEARRTTELAATNAPQDAVLQSLLSEARQADGDLAGAIRAAQRYTELLPHVAGGWARLGMLFVQVQRNSDAEAALTTALRLAPDDVWTLNNLAQLHAQQDQTEAALAEFQQALRIKPRFGLAHIGIGQILEKQGHTNEADAHYRLALQNRIYRAEQLAGLGRLCLARGWPEAAVTNLTDALALSPADASLHRDLAQALERMGRTNEAAPHRAAAPTLDAGTLARFRHGLELGRQGKHAEAAAEFREVVRLQPGLVEARLNFGFALEKQGQRQEALEQFEAALRLSPTNRMAAERAATLRAQ